MFPLLLACALVPTPADSGDTALEADRLQECPETEGLSYSVPNKPNVMLVVDRSGSMDQLVCDGGDCMSRWDSVLTLASYLGDVEAASNLGMALFSDGTGDTCAVDDSVVVPVSDSDDADDRILQALAATSPSGGTPTAAMLEHLVGEPGLQDPARDNVVVMLTDGAPNCICPDGETECEREMAVQAVEALVSQEVPVKLHIIGFGTSSGTQATLEAMGLAAQVTTPAGNVYSADNVNELLERLWAVATSLNPCSFILHEPVAAEDLVVYVNEAELAPCTSEDCVEGWVYDEDSGTVQLAAGSCRELGGAECPDVRFESR